MLGSTDGSWVVVDVGENAESIVGSTLGSMVGSEVGS